MADQPDQRTRGTLLARLRSDPGDQAAWTEFVLRYGPLIRGWCRQWNLSEADAQDVTQNVLVKLVRKMGSFIYDPTKSFRAWLKTVTHHAWNDYLDSRRGPQGTGGSAGEADPLADVVAREDLLQRLDEAFDRELLDEAVARVRLRVAERTWEAFRLLSFEGLSGAEAAAKVGMQVAMVYVAKSKVQKMLRKEIRKLETGEA